MKKIVFILAGIMGMLLASCSETDEKTNSSGTHAFYLNLKINPLGYESKAQTRVVIGSEEGEENVDILYLLFFEKTADGSGKYVDYWKKEKLTMGTDIDIIFDPSSKLSNARDYNVLAVVNIYDNKFIKSSIDEWLTGMKDKTEAQVEKETYAYINGCNDQENAVLNYTDNRIAKDHLLMSGKFIKNGNDPVVHLALDRALVRFDIVNFSNDFVIRTASIWNAYPQAPIFNHVENDFQQERIARYCGVKNEIDSEGKYPKVMAGCLYGLENYVENPQANDTKTTCIIVGLSKKDSEVIKYYRVNIILEGATAQDLKRNDVYRVTVRDDLDESKGKNSELEAFKSSKGGLNYVINNWDLVDDDLIMIDGSGNILAIPTKKAVLRPEGDSREYSIFTLGTGTLTISDKRLDEGLTATLSDHVLSIDAKALTAHGETRTGEIELSFAGMKATVTLIQSGEINKYLNLSTYSVPAFPSAAKYDMDGKIQVESSDSWTATLYSSSSEPIFTFANGQNKQTLKSSEVVGNAFTISTYSENLTANSRYGFVIVQLDSDESINRVIPLTQRGKSTIAFTPYASELTFNGSGSFVSVNGSSQNLTVSPGDNGASPAKFNEWVAEISGADASYFKITPVWDENNAKNNTLKVEAIGTNILSRKLNATVQIYLKAQPSVSTTFKVSQSTYVFTLTPASITTPVSVKGGSTQLITPNGDESLSWKASITMNRVSGINALGSHAAWLIDENGQKMDLTKSYPMNTKFRVAFPKILYPLIKTIPSATVKLTLVGGTASTEITVSQEALTPKAVSAKNMSSGYGRIVGITANFNKYYYEGLNNLNFYGEYGVIPTNSVKPSFSSYVIGSVIPSTVNYFHANMANEITPGSWNYIKSWREVNKNDGLLVVWQDKRDGTAFGSNTSLGELGWKGAIPDSKAKGLATTSSTKKVWQYLMKDGPFTNGISIADDMSYAKFSYDGISYATNIYSLTAGAVPIIYGDTAGTSAMLVIDPVHNLIFVGESQFFDTYSASLSRCSDTAAELAKSKFIGNFIAYVINSAQYGTHFTDAMIDK